MSYDDFRSKAAENARAQARKLVRRVGIGAVSVVALGVFFGSWYRVDEGERAVVLTTGAFSEVAGPGLHFKLPYIQSTRFITVRNEAIKYEQVAAYSFDQQVAELVVSVNYQIDPNDVETIYRQYGSEENAIARVINPRVFEQTKNVFGQYTAQRAIQERGKMNADILQAIQNAVNGSGIQVLSVQVENIDFSDAYEQAVEAAAKAKADIERSKSELLRVEQEAQQKVKQAEAEAEAKKLRADAEAYATEAAGRAEASAIAARGAALRDNPNLIGLVTAEKWDGKLPASMIPGSAVPFVNLK